MQRLFVGIDVSKDFFVAVGLDPKGNELFRISCSMDAQGFIERLQLIMAHCKRIEEVAVAMESTGCYHINLFSHLTSQGIKTVIINPLFIANFAKLSLRKTKTDKEDALVKAATAEGLVFIEIDTGRLDCPEAFRTAGRSMAKANEFD